MEFILMVQLLHRNGSYFGHYHYWLILFLQLQKIDANGFKNGETDNDPDYTLSLICDANVTDWGNILNTLIS